MPSQWEPGQLGGGGPAGARALTLEAPKIEAHLKFAIISCHRVLPFFFNILRCQETI